MNFVITKFDFKWICKKCYEKYPNRFVSDLPDDIEGCGICQSIFNINDNHFSSWEHIKKVEVILKQIKSKLCYNCNHKFFIQDHFIEERKCLSCRKNNYICSKCRSTSFRCIKWYDTHTRLCNNCAPFDDSPKFEFDYDYYPLGPTPAVRMIKELFTPKIILN